MPNKKNLRFVYNKEILDRSSNPGFDEKIENPDKIIKGLNPFCGDEVKFSILISDNKVSSINLKVEGCAVHKASSSILCEIISDESINHIQSICNDFISFFKNEQTVHKVYKNSKLKLASSLFDIKSNQIRIKCALLSWNTIYNNLFSKN
tara:strand:- start:566 stop:1015 length:450 start_codon:yes stop_codon:yes gene_type:complete